MTDVEFEQILSHRPKHSLLDPPQFCLRDMLHFYYNQFCDGETTNIMIKAYTDELYKQFVSRKA